MPKLRRLGGTKMPLRGRIDDASADRISPDVGRSRPGDRAQRRGLAAARTARAA